MVKTITASLLLGAVALILGSLAYFHAVTPDKMQSPIILDADSASVEVPRGYSGDASRLVMDDSGLAVVKWPMAETGAHAFPYLFIHLQGPSLPQSLTVFWKQAATGQHLHRFRVPGRPQMSEQLPISGAEAWRGAITELGLVMQGEPGQAVSLEKMELLPESAINRFTVIFANWFAGMSWNHSSINRNWGGPHAQQLAPRPLQVIAMWLGLSLVLYLLLLRRGSAFDWKIIASIFLLCWLSLDLRWQGNLLLQLRETQALYAGKSNEEKRRAGTDAELFAFVHEARSQMSSVDSRVFVGSSDDYSGMRGAYYLYPYNAYWKRGGPELPQASAILQDDYILVVPPTELSFNPAKALLETPAGDHIAVRLLVSRPVGALFRVL
jgi:hypothetical protein